MSQFKRWVFKQFDAAHGWELWVTDGTSAGTSLLKDIATGTSDSYPNFLVSLGNGKTVFTAGDATGQYELWVTDGTADGTVQVKEIRTDAFGSNPSNVTTIGGGRALFMADDGVHGFEPWITDGTEAGTVLLKDIFSGFSSWPNGFTPLGDGRVLFSAEDAAHGSELWITDGTEAGTVLLLDIEPGAMSSSPLELIPLGNGKVVFRAYTAAEADELWITDGTVAGTVLVKDIFGGVGGGHPSEIVSLGDGRAIFVADEFNTSREVWVTDGTAAGTMLLQDIRPDTDSSYPSNLVAIGTGRALFIAEDNDHGREIWFTDGTPGGTQLLKDIVAGPLGAAQYELAALGDGRAVFAAWDADHGSELWVTDGTEAGTVLLKDIFAGGGGSGPTRMVSLSDGRVMFQATDLSLGQAHWITDGTVAGTVPVQDIPDLNGNGGSPWEPTALGDGRLVFSASDDPNGSEVWVTDGTTAGTTLVRDINPGFWNSDPQDFLSMDSGTVLFVADNESLGGELWVTDGTLAGTSLVQDIAPGIQASYPYGLTRLNGTQAVFTASDGTNGHELWVTDGTSAGTFMIDLYPGFDDSWPDFFQPIGGGRVMFQASGVDGVEPWVTDGTVAGTFQLADIEGGLAGSSAEHFTDAGNGRVVFVAYSSGTGHELWSTNGTVAGTGLEMDIFTGTDGSYPQHFSAIAPGVVVFTADDGVNGNELWATAGNGTGAHLVKDIEPGMFGSYPSSITAVGDGMALFSASTSADGTELWITDGTLAGTVLLADINPGAGGSDPQHFHRMDDGRVLFSANDGSNGYELWITDGTQGGTELVKDIAVGADSSPGNFASLPDGRVVFNAYTNEFSWELWVTDGTAAGTQLVRDIFDAYSYYTAFGAVQGPPTLVDSTVSLENVAEGATNPAGTSMDTVLGMIQVTNPDVTALAITALDTSLGTWQFRLDGAGPWLSVDTALVNSQTDELALLLGPTDSIRLLPFGDLHGTLGSAITFRAWDMSEGAPGDYRLVTPGSGGIWIGSDTASLTVTPVNDAPSFAPAAGDGIVTLDVGVDDVIRSVVVQPDGRILVAGDSTDTTSDLLIARFLPDGSPDSTWGGTGVVLADPSGGGDDSLGQVVLQPDGKVLVSGTIEGATTGYDFGVLRFNSDGTPDLTFGTSGVTTFNFSVTSFDQVNALVLQPDGKVVLAGFTDAVNVYDFALTRLDANGHLDTSFGIGGIVITDFVGNSYEESTSVAIQSDGKLVVAGFRDGASRDFALARYNTDGSLDGTFGVGGMVVTDAGTGSYDEIHGLTVRPDGSIVVVGLSLEPTPGADYTFEAAAYNPDGSLAGPPVAIFYSGANNAGYDVLNQPDGNMVLVGASTPSGTSDIAVIRVTSDISFFGPGTGGLPNGLPIDINSQQDVAYAGALQIDSKILAGGYTDDGVERDLVLVRLLGSGDMDTTFGGAATPTLGNVVAYTENQPAVGLNAAVRVVDPDLAALNDGAGNYAGASVTLSRQGGANGEDVFGIDATGAPFNISGNTLRSGADPFATFTTGSGTISIVFDSSAAIATQALVDAVLGRIGYVNSSDNPPAQVTIAWSFSDGNTAAAQGPGGALTAGGTTTVNITPANDTPVLAVPQDDQDAAVYSAFSYIVPGNTFTDPDGDTLTYSATGLPAWLSFNPTTRTFSGTPGVGNVGSVDITVTATDPSLASTSDVFRLTVAPGAARVYIEGTDIGGGNRTLSANTDFLGAAATGYQWYKDTLAIIGANGASYTPVPATDNFSLYTVQVSHAGGPTTSGAVDPQAATPPAGVLQSTGNPGNDTLPAAPTRAQVFIGYHGLDTITGTNGADWIDGGPDVDSMTGGLGNDTYIAHDALDVIVEAAGGGTDLVMSYVTITLPAEVENLTLVGTGEFGGSGNSLANLITGNGAINTIAGLGGNDSVNAGAGDDSVDGGADNDTLNGGDGGDTLLGGTGNDSLLGGAGSDSLDGGDNDDKLDGGAAADVLLGGNGNDSLIGGGGNDTLRGGGGKDTLTGGAGADKIVLDELPASGQADSIVGFTAGSDKFQLVKTGVFTALNLGTLNGAAFWSGTAAHDPDDRIVYNPTTGALWYDADGNGAGAAIQIATLTGLVGALTQADFVVVA